MSGAANRPVPGRFLIRLALTLFDRATAERYVFPAIADLQHESRVAGTDAGFPRLVRHVGAYATFWIMLLTCLGHAWKGDEAPASLVGASLVAAVAPALVLVCLPLGSFTAGVKLAPSNLARMAVLLIPQAAAIALPMGLLFAALRAAKQRSGNLDGTPSSAMGLVRSVIAASLVIGCVTLAMTGWLAPPSNQIYRATMFRAMGFSEEPARGVAELRFSEFQGEIERSKEASRSRFLRFYRQQMFSIPAACVAFGIFALCLAPTRNTRWRSGKAEALALAVGLGWIACHSLALPLSRRAAFSPEVAAWLANIVVLAMALLIAARRLRKRPDIPI